MRSSLLRSAALLLIPITCAFAQNPAPQTNPAPGKAPMNGYDRSVKLPGYQDPYAGKPKVLFVADLHTGNQIAHDAVSHAMASMEEVARKAGIVVYLRTDTNWISAEDTYGKGDYVKGGSKGAKGRSLKDFAAVVFYTNGETEMTDQQKEDLLAYIRSGKGFVGIHTAAATMYKYPAYADMLGAYFDNHPWGIITAKIKVERPDFPGMEAFVGQPTVTEEFYQMMAPTTAPKSTCSPASIPPPSTSTAPTSTAPTPTSPSPGSRTTVRAASSTPPSATPTPPGTIPAFRTCTWTPSNGPRASSNIQSSPTPFQSTNAPACCGPHFVFRRTLKATEIPIISFVSQPLGRLTDCNKK